MGIDRFLKKAKQIQEDLKERKHSAEAPKHEGDDESNWLISYADMMTLLCAFFIMMFSMSTLNAPQFEKVKQELATEFGGDYQSPSAETAKFVTQIIQEAGIDKDAVITSDPTGVSIIFHSTVFFDTLSAQIREPGRTVLDKLIVALRGREDAEVKKYKVVVEGHTDSRPVVSGIYPTNWELSAARAVQVVRMFLDKGFDRTNVMPIGFADTRPRFPERTPAGTYDEEALSKNRRVVLRILEPTVDSIPWEQPNPAPVPAAPAAAVPPANAAH